MDLLTVVSVLRLGGDYRPQHVRQLARNVRAHLRVPHRFVCLTDAIGLADEHVVAMPLARPAWPGWWSKINLFAPKQFSGPVFYLDLDTVVVSDFSDIAVASSRGFSMLRGMSRPEFPGSGVMAWNVDLSRLFYTFERRPEAFIRTYIEPGKWGDQGFIARNTPLQPRLLQDAFPGRIVSYKIHCQKNGRRPPKGASIVCYHGKPRPWDEPLAVNPELVG